LKLQLKLKFRAIDFVVSIYLLVSGLAILSHSQELIHFNQLVSARILGALIIFLLAREYRSPVLKFLSEFYPYIFTAYFYGETGLFNSLYFPHFDSHLADFDQHLWGFQPSLVFSQTFSQAWFSELMYFGYFSFYFLVFGFALYMYFKQAKEFNFVSFVIVQSFYLFYTVFFLFPAVGPQFYFPAELAQMPNSGMFSTIEKFIQEIGETPTGAFPSSHIGMSWLILVLIKRYSPKVFWPALILVINLSFATVYIKAHYFADVIAGLMSVPVLLMLAKYNYTLYNYSKNLILSLWKF
jgi:membrane-associated phospholipid phosphatase